MARKNFQVKNLIIMLFYYMLYVILQMKCFITTIYPNNDKMKKTHMQEKKLRKNQKNIYKSWKNMHRYNESKEKPDAVAISAEIDQIFQEANPDIEVRVRMININYGHNRKVLSACKPLEEYAWFVSQVRENLIDNKYNKEKKLLGIEDAVDKAINKMPDDFEIKNFMVANRAEVKDMCLTEYDEEETMQMFREEGREE